MKCDQSNALIFGCDHSSAFIFDWIFFILAGNKDNHKISDGFEIWPDKIWTAELAALECLGKSPYTYNGRNVGTTLMSSFLDGSSSLMQVTMTSIKGWMILNFVKIPLPITELAVLERLKINI